jgi:hypothetical protein
MRLMGTIDLRLASSVDALDTPVSGFHALQIRSSPNPRIFTLGSPDQNERDAWAEQL